MLVSFSVSNFLSFNNEERFEMKAGRVLKKKEHIIFAEKNKLELLHFSAIFGKNGAGKTNLVRAISVLKNFVIFGRLPQNATSLWCRTYDENETRTSNFSISFIQNEILYEYSVAVLLATGQLLKEELVRIVGNRHTKLFFRDVNNEYKFHHSLKGQKNDIEVLARSYSLNGTPFLFNINHNTQGFFVQNKEALPLLEVFRWFMETLEVVFPDQPIQETSLLRYNLCKNEFARLLNEFDTGIEEIKLEPVSKEKVFEVLDTRTQQKINMEMLLVKPDFSNPILNFLQPLQKRTYSTVIRNHRDIFIISLEDDNEFHFYVLKFVHNIAGKKIEFHMANESDGTHRLFQLLEILVSDKEKVYIMDELNRSLHPKLTIEFVKKFLKCSENKKIQLITTTHETRIMKHDLLRRDEIWICDTNEDRTSKLFSLEKEQVRIDKVLEENYMDNEWGGIPKFSDDEENGKKQ